MVFGSGFNRDVYTKLQGIVPFNPLNQENSLDNPKVKIGAVVLFNPSTCCAMATDLNIATDLQPYIKPSVPHKQLMFASKHVVSMNGALKAGVQSSDAKVDAKLVIKFNKDNQQAFNVVDCNVTRCNGFSDTDLKKWLDVEVNKHKAVLCRWDTFGVITAEYISGDCRVYTGNKGGFSVIGSTEVSSGSILAIPLNGAFALEADYTRNREFSGLAETKVNVRIGFQIRVFERSLINGQVIVKPSHLGTGNSVEVSDDESQFDVKAKQIPVDKIQSIGVMLWNEHQSTN